MSGIAKLTPYPVYKPSGVEWPGEVPEHWEVLPLKRIGWFSVCVGSYFGTKIFQSAWFPGCPNPQLSG